MLFYCFSSFFSLSFFLSNNRKTKQTKKTHLHPQEAYKQTNNSDSVKSSCRHHLCSCFSNILACYYSHVILALQLQRRTRTHLININGLLFFSLSSSFFPFCFLFQPVLFLLLFIFTSRIIFLFSLFARSVSLLFRLPISIVT